MKGRASDRFRSKPFMAARRTTQSPMVVIGLMTTVIGCRRNNIAVQKGDFEEAGVALRVYN
jgi:hypothetical protein